MKSLRFFAVTMLLFACSLQCFSQENNLPQEVKLPNGWFLRPVGGSLPLGDLPLNIAVSSSKKYIAVTNNGQSTQSIQLIDARHNIILDSIDIPKPWLGLKFSADERY